MCCPGLANAVVLDVQAYIDGRDRLHFQGDNLWWEHFDYAAVGRQLGDYPTNLTVNNNPTISWIPFWPGYPLDSPDWRIRQFIAHMPYQTLITTLVPVYPP